MRDGSFAIWRVRPSGGKPERLTTGTGPEGQPSVARSGSILAYSTYLRDLDVVILDRKTGARSRLRSSSAESSPAIAPDGSSVAYTSNRRGKYDLWWQPLKDGGSVGAERQLTDHPGSVATPSFSPDGRWIAYFRVENGRRDLWLVSTDGRLPRRLTDSGAINVNPRFSPDGSQLAFVSDQGGREHVWVAALSADHKLTGARRVTSGDLRDLHPAWSPEGSRLAFIRASEAWTVGADGSLPARITQGAEAELVRWEPDGEHLLVSGRWGSFGIELKRVPTDGGSPEPLGEPVVFGDDTADGLFDLTRDGRWMVYLQSESRGDIWLMEWKTAEE